MFNNYLKIAWRSLINHKLYSLINICGLSVGITCFILIALFVQYELSYDTHNEKAKNVYRLIQKQSGNEYRGTDYYAVSSRPIGISMKRDFPEVKTFTNLDSWSVLLRNSGTAFSEKGIFTDPAFFDVFTINIISGQPKEALQDPNTILLTRSLAKKLFGDTSPLDQQLNYNGDRKVIVKGVIEDPPKNSHFTYSFIASIKNQRGYANDFDRWVSNNYYTYVLLEDGADTDELTAKIKTYEKLSKPEYASVGLYFHPEYELQSLRDIHLKSNINIELSSNGDIRYVYFYTLIAFVILLIAAINYINLATAKSMQRGKEVGITKVLGAKKVHLMLQFLGESFLITLISFLLGLVMTIAILPYYNLVLSKEIPLDILGVWWVLPSMVLLAFCIGVLSGLYPALFLSKLNTVKALKGAISQNGQKGGKLRGVFVIGQFASAIVLAFGSVVIHQQLDYIKNKNLGYNKDGVVHVGYWEKKIGEKTEVIKNELLKHSKIQKVSISRQLPMNLFNQGPIDKWEGNEDNSQLFLYRSNVDYDFTDLFEIELIQGRSFSKSFPTDSSEAYLINEAVVRKLGWENPIGKGFNGGKVIGVVKDFHLQTLDLSIEPLYMSLGAGDWDRTFGQIIMKINMEDFAETRNFIKATLHDIAPYVPFEVEIMENSYAQLYDSENRLGTVLNVFTFLALFIAAIGLVGLVSFRVTQRTKEIGIRKVLGSSIFSIVTLLTKDYIRFVLISIAIAFPIAYYVMSQWLQGFAYNSGIQWPTLVMIGFCSIALAAATIGIQSIKAAMTNPIKSLRTE